MRTLGWLEKQSGWNPVSSKTDIEKDTFTFYIYVLMLFWGEVNNCKSWLVCSNPTAAHLFNFCEFVTWRAVFVKGSVQDDIRITLTG